MRIARNARKHGITDEEMLHAIRNHKWRHQQDGVMIEVGVLTTTDGDDVVIHAMRVRSKFLP